MNITDNLIRIKEGKDNIIKSLKNKGVSIADNTLINEIPIIIDNAEIGGGGSDTPSQPEIPELIQKYEGSTVFRINVPTDNYEFAINLCNNATASYDVDWGDGSLEYGLTTDEQHHTYSKSGTYDVNIYNLSKDITLGGIKNTNDASVTSIYYLFNNSNNDYWLGKYIYQQDNSTVTNVLLGDKITSIGQYAFSSCTSLTNIVIPNSVKSIDKCSFYNCTKIKSITIPNSVPSIGNDAFGKCSSLQSIVIPESVKIIGSNAFDSCSSLQSIVIPEGVTSIYSNAFQSCSSLQSIDLPSTLTSIDGYTFNQCTSLQSVVISEGVTSIGERAFGYCNSLQSITIPNSVTSIGNTAFQYCSSLKSIVIPESVTTIGSGVFKECSLLQNIVIPESVTSIGSSTFYNCTYLQSITCEAMTAPTIQSNTFPTSSFKYTKRYIYVPKNSQGYNEGNWKTYLIDKGWELRYIEDRVKTPTTLKLETKNNFLHKWDYIGQAKLVDYELVDNEYIYHFDDKIIELLSNTFYLNVLEAIELPEGVEVLGEFLFYSALSLKTLNIPLTVRTIGKSCFYRVPIQEIIIPEGVEILPDSMCDTCTSLKTVNIPSTVTSIGKRCFTQNNSLRTIISKSTQAPTIASDTFQNISVSVPSGTPKILRIPQGSSGYEETTSEWYKQLISKGYKVEYIVPNTLTYTSYSGDTVTPYAKSFEGKNEIVSNVYENGIGTLTFKEELTEIYDSMYNKDVVDEITTIEIPDNITRIGDYSFRGQYLTTLNVPDSVTYIGDSAFNNCTNLTEITLGSGVETIGQWAFVNCKSIATITSMAMVAPTLNQSFMLVGDDVSGDKILRVPEGAEGYDVWLSQLSGFTVEYI